ncbi:MAG: hypothetical protein KF814_04595 [Nitrospiraceae bacterium]|nr:hypothetical protein [Nitrospiraceae bacterium]
MGGACLVLLFTLPLIGVALSGQPIQPYLRVPPTTHPVVHEPFSWPVFGGLALLIMVTVGPVLHRLFASSRAVSPSWPEPAAFPEYRRFPWWGWLGLTVTAISWFLAWTRLDWMGALQSFTFTPLWIGYILTVNALTFRRVGRCMLLHRPRYVASLFPLSAAFWWTFEYLNRFVQNWHYLGSGDLSASAYVLQATVPFSTVLPAVIGTAECLSAYPNLSAGLQHWVKFSWCRGQRWGWLLLICSVFALVALGRWPSYLFPLVWVAPLSLITAIQLIRGVETIFASAAEGDWRVLWVVALSALICGWFWELWNVGSLAHWEYSIPFVDRVHLFEMPILGYAGYLPFGLECLAVADLFLLRRFSGGVDYYRATVGATDLAQRNPMVAER